jgi:hypothetical protein
VGGATTTDPEAIAWARLQSTTVWAVYGVSIDLDWQVDLYLARPQEAS